MADNALTACAAKPRIALASNMQDKRRILVFIKDAFQPPPSTQYWEMIEDASVYIP